MKYTSGIAVGAMSGSIGGSTASHNRYGPYFRTRAIPVTSTTVEALAAKARFANASSDWGDLTDGQRLSWGEYAAANPIVDSLGMTQTLSANAAFVGIRARQLFSGDTLIADPPISASPDALTSLTFTADIGTGNFELVFTPTPLGAGIKLWLQAAVVSSLGINYVQNLLRVVQISAAAATSPHDDQTEIEARLGVLVVGQRVTQMVSTYNGATGQLSRPLRIDAVVIDTP